MSAINFIKNMSSREKFILFLLAVTVALSVIFLLQSYSSARRYKKLYETEANKDKKEIQEDIKRRNKIIDSLLNENAKQEIIIKKANFSLDSLEKVKNKVQIKYKTKYKEIELYNTEDIKNYWKNEFKD
jgi:hypothetical protein